MNRPLAPHDVAVAIHVADARVLLASLPRLDNVDLHTIRGDFARWASRTRPAGSGSARSDGTWSSWQEAWNTWTGAAPHTPGRIRYTPHRCARCSGRRVDFRRGTVCGSCLGTGRHRGTATQTALWVPEPPANAPNHT